MGRACSENVGSWVWAVSIGLPLDLYYFSYQNLKRLGLFGVTRFWTTTLLYPRDFSFYSSSSSRLIINYFLTRTYPSGCPTSYASRTISKTELPHSI